MPVLHAEKFSLGTRRANRASCRKSSRYHRRPSPDLMRRARRRPEVLRTTLKCTRNPGTDLRRGAARRRWPSSREIGRAACLLLAGMSSAVCWRLSSIGIGPPKKSPCIDFDEADLSSSSASGIIIGVGVTSILPSWRALAEPNRWSPPDHLLPGTACRVVCRVRWRPAMRR